MTCPCTSEATITAAAAAIIAPRWCTVYADGSARWLAVRWHGLPAPLRVLGVATGLWSIDESKRLPGCGCIVPLKAAWTRAAQVFARFLGPAPRRGKC